MPNTFGTIGSALGAAGGYLKKNPDLLSTIISAGAGIGGAIAGNKAQAGLQQQDIALEQQRLAIERALLALKMSQDERTRQTGVRQDLAASYGAQTKDRFGRAELGLKATEMDPVAQQKALFAAARMRELAKQGAPFIQPGSTQVQNRADLGGIAEQWLGDPALLAGTRMFEGARAAVNPYGLAPDFAAQGFGSTPGASDATGEIRRYLTDQRAQLEAGYDAERQALMEALNVPLDPQLMDLYTQAMTEQAQQQAAATKSGTTGASQPKEKKKGSFWSKLLGIAAIPA